MLTLMAVHAHPDDEAISTGGVLARYKSEGVRTVLVTCTDGRCGDGPDGVKPGDPGHDPDKVAMMRMLELERSCRALGVDHLEMLGYQDSGMMGWPTNDEPRCFWQAPVTDAAERLAELFRRYRPDVVITYDEDGFYGHPDHIQAHRITVAACDLLAEEGIPAKLYWTAVPRSRMAEFGRRIQELGIEFSSDGEEDPGPREEWGTPDEQVTTEVEVGPWTQAKFESLHAHESQSDNIFFLRMGSDVFAALLSLEFFVRVRDTTGAAVPESDLFAGLR